MNRAGTIREVTLGGKTNLNELVAVARYCAKVTFSCDYKKRVNDARELIERFVSEGRRIYCVTSIELNQEF